jgi:predicted Rossmann fold flavoprotein
MEKSSWDVIVAGGGPAGFFAAIRCAELNPNLHVLILEKASQTLGKVLVSGGGRCNVTHACFDPAQLITYYPRGGAALRGAFTRFQPADTVQWFEERGVKLKTEADNRIFPVTDSSKTIAECLRNAAKKAGAQVQLGANLQRVEKIGGGFRLEVFNAARMQHLQAPKLLIATGSDAVTREIVGALGHSIETPVPSLFTFKIADARLEGLAGLSVESITVKMGALTQRGPILITHWGLSGPAILRLSAWGARELFEKKYHTTLTVNWLGYTTPEKAFEVLHKHKYWPENVRKKASTKSAFSQLPARLWKQLAQEIVQEKNWGAVSNAELRKLAEELTAGRFEITGKGQFKEEFVTCGGVRLNEVDFKTMQSRLVDGLFFAGEVLDVDGITGGFNFQSSWTTGWLAGSAMGVK